MRIMIHKQYIMAGYIENISIWGRGRAIILYFFNFWEYLEKKIETHE